MWMAPVDRITHRVWAWSVGRRATLAPKPPSPAQVGVLMNPGLHSGFVPHSPGSGILVFLYKRRFYSGTL